MGDECTRCGSWCWGCCTVLNCTVLYCTVLYCTVQVRVLVLGVLLPLCDLCVDLGKAAVLVFDFPQKQDLESWRGFADHFHTNGGFGSSSLEIFL